MLKASSNTSLSRSGSQTELAAFAASRFARCERDATTADASNCVVETLASSVLNTDADWLRRPSISLDGTPHLVSLKLSRPRNDTVRILVEPGHLGMTVATQIAFSLETLDKLLGLLSWRSAAGGINAVTRTLLPENPHSTDSWWGGIWLGVACLDTAPELRAYFNLRFGSKPERWRRVAKLLKVFSGAHTHEQGIRDWLERLSTAIPVGLGTVIRDGRIAALRIYVSTHYDPSNFTSLCTPISTRGATTLTSTCTDFYRQFGEPPSQSVTIGYDFGRGEDGRLQAQIGRVKVELCCQALDLSRRSQVLEWIVHRSELWSLDTDPLASFLTDVRSIWRYSAIDFISLGFTPDPSHLTVYVKPWS